MFLYLYKLSFSFFFSLPDSFIGEWDLTSGWITRHSLTEKKRSQRFFLFLNRLVNHLDCTCVSISSVRHVLSLKCQVTDLFLPLVPVQSTSVLSLCTRFSFLYKRIVTFGNPNLRLLHLVYREGVTVYWQDLGFVSLRLPQVLPQNLSIYKRVFLDCFLSFTVRSTTK